MRATNFLHVRGWATAILCAFQGGHNFSTIMEISTYHPLAVIVDNPLIQK